MAVRRMVIANVVPLVHLESNRVFSYAIPPKFLPEVRSGSLVKIPLRQRLVDGVVISLTRRTKTIQLKNIERLELTQAATKQTLELAWHLSDRYLGELGECLNAVIPS